MGRARQAPVEHPRDRQAADGEAERERHEAERRVRRVPVRLGADHRRDDRRYRDEPADDRQEREDHERQRHHRRRLVQVVARVLGDAALAEERHEEEAPGVVRGEQRDDEADDAEHRHRVRARRERAPEDLVLAEEARERPDARERQDADRHGGERDRHLAPEAAHALHVLLAAEPVDDAAGAEEEERLEERVRHEVEDRRPGDADAERQEHVAELAHRRVGEHLLDVHLRRRDDAGEERRRRADDGDDRERRRRERVEPLEAGQEVHPRR
jgi:hypothetical protein